MEFNTFDKYIENSNLVISIPKKNITSEIARSYFTSSFCIFEQFAVVPIILCNCKWLCRYKCL